MNKLFYSNYIYNSLCTKNIIVSPENDKNETNYKLFYTIIVTDIEHFVLSVQRFFQDVLYLKLFSNSQYYLF